MQWLKTGFMVILVLIAVFLLVGLLVLPDRVFVDRTITITAPPERIFPLVSNFREFNRWSPWAEKDPNTQYTFEGPESGVGAKVYWYSENKQVGSGSQEIIESRDNELVRTALDFGEQGTASASYMIESTSEGSRVTWGLMVDAEGSIIGRYFGLLMDRMVGPEYEKGLDNLRKIAENR